MNREGLIAVAVVILVAFAAWPAAEARTVVVGASGGDKNAEINKWREQKVDEFCAGIRRQDPAAECNKATTEKAMRDAITKAAGELVCGDKLVIYYNGHGMEDRLVFVNEGKSLSVDELMKALKNVQCCVSVCVVIHACHSGSFVDDLAKDRHVKQVYTCCAANEKNHKDFAVIDGRMTHLGQDWPTGYNEDLAAVPPGSGIDKALEEASKSAATKRHEEFRDRATPQRYVREPVTVLAHVEAADANKIKIHIWDPPELHCQTRFIRGTPDFPLPKGYKECNWVTATIVPAVGTTVHLDEGGVNLVGTPVVEIKGHVEKITNTEIEVIIWEPPYMRGQKRVIRRDPNLPLPDGIQVCSWLVTSTTVTAPTKPLVPAGPGALTDPPTTGIYGHVVSTNARDKTARVYVWEPPHLRGTYIVVKYDELPKTIKRCVWISDTVSVTDPDTEMKGSGAPTVAEPPTVEIHGHVEDVRRTGKDKWVEIMVTSPEHLKGKTIKVAADSVPDWVQECEWITVPVSLADPSGNKGGLAPGGTFGTPETRRIVAHVTKRQDDKTLLVHIKQPESVKCNSRALTKGQNFPADLKNCSWVIANVRSSRENFYDVVDLWHATGEPNQENEAPGLGNRQVIPGTGDTTQPFRYLVDYSDADNDPPIGVYLDLPGGTFQRMRPLDPTDTDYTDGATFTFEHVFEKVETPGPQTSAMMAYDGQQIAELSPTHAPFVVLPTPTPTPFAWGDLNGDQLAGVVDASLLLQWDAFIIDGFPGYPDLFRPEFPAASDVSGDGEPGTLDASLLLQLDAFVIECLPLESDTDCDGLGPEQSPTPLPTDTPTPAPTSDIDGDELPDGVEQFNPLSGGTHILLPDSDGDGLFDGDEDRDGNQVYDGNETSPRNRDTDGDQYWDSFEEMLETSPLAPNPDYLDQDGDQLPAELDPNDFFPDSDNDRFLDSYETAWFGDEQAALDPAIRPPLGDASGDGIVDPLDGELIQGLADGTLQYDAPFFDGPVHQDGFRFVDADLDGLITPNDANIVFGFAFGGVPFLPALFDVPPSELVPAEEPK